jgi:hypothetical protein
MQWSKLKRRAELFFAPSVAGRVELRTTNYRGAHDAAGRGWITIDGEKAWSFCTLRHGIRHHEIEDGLRAANGGNDFRDPSQRDAYYAAIGQADDILEREGIVSQSYFEGAVATYPSLAIDEALVSDNLVHRALAVLDKRLGKRRLASLSFRTDEHPLVVGLHRFRCAAEGVRLPTGRRRADVQSSAPVSPRVRLR